MTISATPSLSEIHAEFGGTGPFSDYIRGGSFVPDIPGNSAISSTVSGLALDQFIGSANADNSSLDWGNIIADDSGANPDQELIVGGDITFTNTQNTGSGFVAMYVNGGVEVSGYTGSPGDDIYFNASTFGGDATGTVQVFSDGALIDSFTYTITNTSGGGF